MFPQGHRLVSPVGSFAVCSFASCAPKHASLLRMLGRPPRIMRGVLSSSTRQPFSPLSYCEHRPADSMPSQSLRTLCWLDHTIDHQHVLRFSTFLVLQQANGSVCALVQHGTQVRPPGSQRALHAIRGGAHAIFCLSASCPAHDNSMPLNPQGISHHQQAARWALLMGRPDRAGKSPCLCRERIIQTYQATLTGSRQHVMGPQPQFHTQGAVLCAGPSVQAVLQRHCEAPGGHRGGAAHLHIQKGAPSCPLWARASPQHRKEALLYAQSCCCANGMEGIMSCERCNLNMHMA